MNEFYKYMLVFASFIHITFYVEGTADYVKINY